MLQGNQVSKLQLGNTSSIQTNRRFIKSFMNSDMEIDEKRKRKWENSVEMEIV
jgi:hypothetical protein